MKRLLTLFFALGTLTASAAQNEKVGLVLSGGGAKGLYHVGILQALEENDIPIDYISGASMGAIVGALYAAGWSPERMKQFFLTDSVSRWLTGKIPEQYRYYYRQFAPTPEMVSVKVNPDTTFGKQILQLPTNVVSPYLIDLAMNDLLAPASAAAGGNFDSLLIPFRCVASNMNDRSLVTFRGGSLPFAVRTSMTIPMVFKPLVYQDSTLLFDGGVLNNFPYQTLREDFQPAIIIGGICTGNSKTPDQSDLVGQIMTLVTQKTDYTLPDSLDITIRGDLSDVGMLDYGKAAEAIQRGYDDAMAQMDEIRRRIDRRVSRAEMARRRATFAARQPQLVFDNVQIEGLTPKQTAYVRRNLGLHLHRQFTFAYLYERYLKLIATGIFQGEFPQVVYDPASGCYTLRIRMRTEPSLRFSLGGNLSTNSLNQAYIGAEYQRAGWNVATYGIQGYFGYFYNGVKVGGRHDMFTNFPFYIDWGYAYQTINWQTSNADPYYRNKDWRMNTQISHSLHTSIAIPVLGNSAFRARLEGNITSYSYFESLHTSQDVSSRSFFSQLGLTTEVETNTMNFSMYPTRGVRQFFSVGYHYAREEFSPGSLVDLPGATKNRGWFEARYMREHYIPIARWFSLGYLVDAVFSNHPAWSSWLSTAVTAPRFTPTPHTQTLFMPEYASSSYLGAGIAPVFNFLRNGNFYLKTYAYVFAPEPLFYDRSAGIFPAERVSEYLKYIFGGSFVYQTPIGPASITVAKYTTGPQNWNFMFNFGYTLF